MFFFEVDCIQQSREVPGRYIHRLWQPPNEPGSNVRVPGHTTGRLFLFQNTMQQNGSFVIECPNRPPGLLEYQTMSMYYDSGRFYVLDYDVTAPERNIAPRRDSHSSASDDDDDGIHDWGFLGFQYTQIFEACTSYAMMEGDQERLMCQRHGADQIWPHMLLPRDYHTANNPQGTRCALHAAMQDNGQKCGGLIGQIAVLIGLLAFSVKASHVERTLQACIRHGRWVCPNPRNEEPQRGCKTHKP